jgi:hypothetical protein
MEHAAPAARGIGHTRQQTMPNFCHRKAAGNECPVRRRARLVVHALLSVLLLTLPPVITLAAEKDVEVVDVESARFDGKAEFTGMVKVTRQKPIEGLLLTLEFLDAQGSLLTIQKQAIEDKQLNLGDEVFFDLEGRDVPRAVSFRVVMYDSKGMVLSVSGGGPYPF